MEITTKEAFAEFRLSFDAGDPWGSTMAWWFAVADALMEAAPELVPNKWQFRQSPLGPDTESYEYETCRTWPAETLVRFGNALSRYAAMLKAAGKDY